MSGALILFARAPSLPGKTRLTAHLSADAAQSLRHAIFLDTLEIAGLAAAHAAGLTSRLVGRWYDVDTPVDLARVGDAGTDEVARHTRRWLAQQPG